LSNKISDELIKKYGHYVQAINYPTVPKGEEKLRIAPTPHHTVEMMDQFANDLAKIWIEVGLELKPRAKGALTCPAAVAETCVYCEKPLLFKHLEARTRPVECQKPNCPQLVIAASA
jgi:5-aminolevulinate synthase